MSRSSRAVWLGAVLIAAVTAGPAFAGPTVYVGPNLAGPPPGLTRQADALFFYPKVTTVRVGDSVTWQFRGFHTVTFPGTYKAYPFVAPQKAKQPATKDATGDPLWWGGAGPVLAISPLSTLQQGGAAISSPSEVRSSGLMRIFVSTPKSPPAPYTLTFTKPGTYRFLCAVHPSMRGIVRVLPSSTGVPSAAAQAQEGAAELSRTIADAKALDRTKPAGKLTVLVGLGHRGTGAEIAAFYPKKLVVAAGSTVTFRNGDQTDIHTVTFGPEKLRSKIEQTFAAPSGKQVLINPLGGFSSEPPGSGVVDYDGSNHGNGYLNSGLLQPRGAPAAAGPQTFKVTFSQAGTYHFECVIHAHMDGTVVVR